MTDAGTPFALLQRSLEVPDVEKLKRAFRLVKGLTDTDAHTLANDAFGILVNNLSPADAMTLQGALHAEGIDTAAVLQTDLPQLPSTKFVHQLDCVPDALVVHDAIGREVPVPWDHIMLIAAGSVIVRDVPSDALAVARGRQEEKPGWARRYREHKAAEKKRR